MEKYINGFGYFVYRSISESFCRINNGELDNVDGSKNSGVMWNPSFERSCSDGTLEGIELVIRNPDLTECIDSYFEKRQ